jgi:cytochrome c-type biogenesis protein CcmF
MTVLGNILILVALVLAAGSAFFLFRSTLAQGRSERLAGLFLAGSVGAVIVASAILVSLLLTHDFSNGYVFSYSSRSLPLFYLLSSFYAGQEGSFLFWVLCAGLIALVLWGLTRNGGRRAEVMAVYMLIYSGLLLLVAIKSPFQSLWQMFPDAPAGMIPADGRGLNPLLQNFWMVIHPPVLFIGFAAMTVPCSFAIVGLWKREYSLLPRQALPWVLAGAAVLGLGIMLGAYWAYGVLGWGGYWGWDPVENSSLIPWLITIALIHTLVAQQRTGRYLRTNFALAIAALFFTIYSTFLTRSGVLGDASVHAFTGAGSTVYWMLLVFLVAIAAAGLGMMTLRWKELASGDPSPLYLSRETALGAGALVLLLSAAVILFGTSLPIFSSSSVEPSFYDTTNLPIAIAMVLLVGFSLTMQWEQQDARDTARRAWKSLAVATASTAVLILLGVRDPLMALLAFAAIFALAVNLDAGVRVARGDWRFLGGKIAHIGLALFLLGVISTGKYSLSRQAVLPVDTPVEVLGRTLTYRGHVPLPDGKFGFNVELREGTATALLQPVMFDAGQQGIMRNPDIASFLTRDIYLSPLALEEGGAHESDRHTLSKGGTVKLGDAEVTFERFDMGSHGSQMGSGAMTVGSVLEVRRGSEQETVTPEMIYTGGAEPQYRNATSRLLGGEVQLLSMNVGGASSPSVITVELRKPGEEAQGHEALVVEASVKPFVNLLWGGTVVMMIGFGLATLKRARQP